MNNNASPKNITYQGIITFPKDLDYKNIICDSALANRLAVVKVKKITIKY